MQAEPGTAASHAGGDEGVENARQQAGRNADPVIADPDLHLPVVGLGVEAGTFGWAGAAGTIAFADLKRGWRGGFYAQYMPASAYPIQGEFPQVAMKDALAALGENA